MPNPVKISSFVITFNEEDKISRCLESLEEVSDEILVVDSFSTDRTVEIAERFGVRVLKHEFHGYIEQRNYAMENSRFDHVLALDADEALSIELSREIQKIKQNWDADAYVFNRRNHFCGRWIKHGLWYPDRKLRLWDRRKGRSRGENPHDKIVMEPGAVTRKIKGDLLHYTISTVSDYFDQLNKFSSIQARSTKLRDMNPNFFHLYLKPFYKFVLAYIFRLGFLDGWRGFCIAIGQAWGIYLRYVKIIDAKRSNPMV